MARYEHHWSYGTHPTESQFLAILSEAYRASLVELQRRYDVEALRSLFFQEQTITGIIYLDMLQNYLIPQI